MVRLDHPLRKLTHIDLVVGLIHDLCADERLDGVFECDDARRSPELISNEKEVLVSAEKLKQYLRERSGLWDDMERTREITEFRIVVPFAMSFEEFLSVNDAHLVIEG